MIAAILGVLGFLLFWAIVIPLWVGGTVAMSPHSPQCLCSKCLRRKDKVQAEYDRAYPPQPGTVRKTWAEWEAEEEQSE